jgi:hypothetical protein
VVEYGRSYQIPAGIALYFWGLIFFNHLFFPSRYLIPACPGSDFFSFNARFLRGEPESINSGKENGEQTEHDTGMSPLWYCK